jgi:hypothetical protein
MIPAHRPPSLLAQEFATRLRKALTRLAQEAPGGTSAAQG